MAGPDWISIVDAIPSGLSEQDNRTWRRAIVSRLETGKMPAVATRLVTKFIAFADDEIPPASVHYSTFISANGGSKMRPYSIESNVELDCDFWRSEHAEQSTNFERIEFCFSAFANWQQCEFGSIDYYAEEDFGGTAALRIRDAVNVKINRELLDAFNRTFQPSQSSDPTLLGRPVKYDWNGSWAHLIAIAELDGLAPEPEKLGTQARIESEIADWFANNGSSTPSEAAIRKQAQLALRAIRNRSRKGQ